MMYVGVMSGTSCDGIDMALVDFDGGVKTLHSRYFAYDNLLKNKLLALISDQPVSISELSGLDAQLGQLYGQKILQFLQENNINRESVEAIGLHGQTVFHSPNHEFANTIQLGSAAITAKQTGITTVANFRQLDVAHGGQGAPLAPVFHQEIFQDKEQTILVLNLGGIANISLLKNKHVLGFDTGPANCLMDEWIMQHKNESYDAQGQWARTGQVHTGLLRDMLCDRYFQQKSPKSTGRELFNSKWLEKHLTNHDVEAVDVQRTLLQLTVDSITKSVKQLNENCSYMVVCGGGAHNSFLLELLATNLQIPIHNSIKFGIDPDFVESVLMAWLAHQNMTNQRLDLQQVTGTNNALLYGVQNLPY